MLQLFFIRLMGLLLNNFSVSQALCFMVRGTCWLLDLGGALRELGGRLFLGELLREVEELLLLVHVKWSLSHSYILIIIIPRITTVCLSISNYS